jgi:hypothetical protein
MSMPPPPAVAAVVPSNPLEAGILSLNTNTYLIGLSMLLLNLGGRHLAMGLTPDQDKFFQGPWIRRGMLFVVIFVATRNVFTALWLTIAVILVIGYLLNEHSSLYLFGEPKPLPPQAQPLPATTGLTPEEQDIYKKLHDKANRSKKDPLKDDTKEKSGVEQIEIWYKKNMEMLRTVIS